MPSGYQVNVEPLLQRKRPNRRRMPLTNKRLLKRIKQNNKHKRLLSTLLERLSKMRRLSGRKSQLGALVGRLGCSLASKEKRL